MPSKSSIVLPPIGYTSKKYAAWLRARGATDKATGKPPRLGVPRATRSDKGTKRK